MKTREALHRSRHRLDTGGTLSLSASTEGHYTHPEIKMFAFEISFDLKKFFLLCFVKTTCNKSVNKVACCNGLSFHPF
jgi:hypothetical protein